MNRNLKTWLGAALARAGGCRIALRDRVAILAFHRIWDRKSTTGIDYGVSEFDRLCAFLARRMRVVPLRQQVDELCSGVAAGGTISITFDDGYLDNYETAAPILEEHGLPATFFIASGFIGTNTVPRWDREFADPPGWMSWEQVKSLSKRGFEIGCHTKSHADLGQISPREARIELHESRAELQDRLGIRADLFAYPFGGIKHMSPENLELVRQMDFKCCLSCFGGVNGTRSDPFELRRIPINDWYATPEQFGFELLAGRIKSGSASRH